MGTKRDALLVDLSSLCQAKDLKSAAVGKDWPSPSHKLVKSTMASYNFGPWPKRQMVGIPQYHLGPGLPQPIDVDAFDRANGSYRHERRQFNRSMWRVESRPARTGVVIDVK